MTDTKKAAFDRVIVPRVERAVTSILLLRAGSGYNYEASDEDVDTMITSIEDAVREVRVAYKRQSAPQSAVSEPGGKDTPAPRDAPARPRLIAAPHIMQIGECVDALPREHLTTYLTHIANRICDPDDRDG